MSLNDSYKAQWARYVARHKLQRDLEATVARVDEDQEKFGSLPHNSVSALSKLTEVATGGGLIPEHHGRFKVGIVGGGVAGLFTALILDWLNKNLGKDKGEEYLDIDYEILEAADEDRLGGRLYTHRFSDLKGGVHDYYDVGAMRFPENDVMKRTFQLFEMLGIEKGRLGDRKKADDPPKLVPYSLKDEEQPSYFNDLRRVGDPWEGPRKMADPFELNKGVAECDQIPTPPDETKNPGGIPDGPGYNYSTIQWIETATFGTGWYDQSLTEAVLESLDFNTRKEPKKEEWWCVDGGAQRIAERMRGKLGKPNAIKFNTQVTAVESNFKINNTVSAEMTLKVKDTSTKKEEKADVKCLTVLNSTTLGSMNHMDLSKTGLFWDTKQAIRCLGYGASCKVGMKFKTAWWREAPYNIKQGGLARTDLPLQVCVYPSYNVNNEVDPVKEPNVLLVSYTWGQTAQRLASLIPSSKGDSDAEKELRSVLIHDLTLLHSQGPSDTEAYKKTRARIAGDLMEVHGYDWYRDPHMAGAFAFFGPCQFWDLYPAITKPNSFGQLYFIGEAASAHHAWVGALESVVRAVWLMFDCLHQGSKNDARRGANKDEGFAPYAEAMKLLEEGPKSAPEIPLPFYPLPAELPKRCKDTEKKRADQLVDHPELDDNSREVPIKYGAAVVALSMVESTLNHIANSPQKST
ncbi:hypothetical protein INS49_015395 [Diaporthe citri]|uniref:uncharacterized protein n=1 Tax=Diaporthe citri TaxID=83186 RepID=UPI001C819036|nr:uncharacterized protein INS49_015395 [Diaporthe citri]KAG6356010.1 hypothetical protein INS49_015395 [Diaporthe citri]